MYFSFKNRIGISNCLSIVLGLLVLQSCGIRKKNPNDRFFIPELEQTQPEDARDLSLDPIMRNLPDDSLKGQRACKWLDKITNLPGQGRFRLAHDVDVASKHFWEVWKRPIQYTDLFDRNNQVNFEPLVARTDIAANPLYQFALAYFSDQNIPNSSEFFKLFDRKMFANPILFPGFLALRALLTLGIINSVDTRNKEIQKEVLRTFPGVFASAPAGTLKASFIKPLLRNGTSNLSQLSPWKDSSVSVEKRSEQFWTVMSRYGKTVPLFSSSTWKSFNDEMRISLSVAIESWSSQNPEEQACASILFQRAQGELLTIMGHDRPGFTVDANNQKSALFDIPQLLTARDATTLRVCPTPGSFIKNGRRSFIALNDFAVEQGKRQPPIHLAKGPYVAGPCSNPISRQSSEYANFRGPQVSPNQIGSGNDLIDFVSSASQFSIAFNPGAPWWRTRTFPLLNLTALDSLEKSNAIMPSVTYALSLGLMMIGLERVINDHLIMVDFKNRRTANEDIAMGVRISDKPDPDHKLVTIVSDAQAALRMTELSFKFYETLETLANWHTRRLREIGGDPEAMREYKESLAAMFGNEKNFNEVINNRPGSIRARLKKLQLATSLLVTKFAKRQSNGSYTCFTQLQSNLESGEEIASGDCKTQAPQTEKLFKNVASILAKKYSSPLFAEYAR